MSKKLVLLDWPQKHVARLILNDPDSRNAMSEEMGEQFAAEVRILSADKTLRALILTGAGAAFSAGGNLQMLREKAELSAEKNRDLMLKFYDCYLSIRAIEVPVIAAINGHAVGAGLCLSLASDIRIACESAKLGFTFVKLGLHPGMGVTYFLPRLIGQARAADLLFTGKMLAAAEAAQMGLISACVADDQFEHAVVKTVQEVLSAGPQAARQLKQSLQESERRTLAQCLQREADCQSINYASAEFIEGVSAAMEKRAPKF